MADLEGLEIRSLLLGARWACRRHALPLLHDGLLAQPSGGRPIASPFRVGARIEALASQLLGADSCLPQAVAAAAYFRRHGQPVELVVGVRRAGGFAAHAWVELAGMPVVGGAERPGYQPIWRGAV